MQDNPTYNLSPSIINSSHFYKQFPQAENLEDIIDSIKGIFKPNIYFERGNKYEEEVFSGMHGKVSQLVMPLTKQKWGNAIIKFKDFNIRITGKADVIDTVNKRIYDIKRTTKFNAKNYLDSVQHLLYFYMFPEMKDFYYLVAAGGDTIESEHIVHVPRPDNLEELVHKEVATFIDFLKEENLWELYKQNKEYKRRF